MSQFSVRGDFQEENLLDGTEVLDDTAVGQEEGATDDPGRESEQTYPRNDGDNPDLWQLPFDGTGFEVGVVVGDSDGGQDQRTGQ